MGYIKEEIKKLIKGKGRAKASKESIAWFESGLKDRKEKAVGSTRGRFIPGKLYVFNYKPVSENLMWFDDKPVVLALDPYNGDDIGVNITILPPNIREDFLDEVYEKYSAIIKAASKTKSADAQRGLPKFSYIGAKKYLEKSGYDFAIRRYKKNGKSNQAVIAYKDWCKMAIIDFNSLQGIDKKQLIKLFEDHRRKKNI